MKNLTTLTIKDALAGLKKKEFTAVELTEAHIKAAEAARHLNCFITETFDVARKQAAASDARYAKLHHGVIARFGRFPHRNAILGRASTPDEEAFLQEPGSRF